MYEKFFDDIGASGDDKMFTDIIGKISNITDVRELEAYYGRGSVPIDDKNKESLRLAVLKAKHYYYKDWHALPKGGRTFNALRRAGFDFIEEFIGLNVKDISRIRGVGSKGINLIDKELLKYDYPCTNKDISYTDNYAQAYLVDCNVWVDNLDQDDIMMLYREVVGFKDSHLDNTIQDIYKRGYSINYIAHCNRVSTEFYKTYLYKKVDLPRNTSIGTIRSLGVSGKCVNVLGRAGIHTIDDLLNVWNYKKLLSIRGVGKVIIKELSCKLYEKGYINEMLV